MRGVPVHENELKKKHGIWLTDTAWNKAKRIGQAEGKSIGEVIEQLIREADGG